jgi:hypothetical protein
MNKGPAFHKAVVKEPSLLTMVLSIPAGAAMEAALKMPIMVISLSRYSKYGFVSIFEHRPTKSLSLNSATRQVAKHPKRRIVHRVRKGTTRHALRPSLLSNHPPRHLGASPSTPHG